jgi:hypothetical protein
MFNFKVYERPDRVELGTVATACGKGGKIGLLPSNVNDSSKRVVLFLKRADGTSDTVVCSTKVSTLLRSKELTLAMVAKFTVIEQANVNGEIINLVSMPTGSAQMIETAVADLKDSTYEPQAVNFESLVLF